MPPESLCAGCYEFCRQVWLRIRRITIWECVENRSSPDSEAQNGEASRSLPRRDQLQSLRFNFVRSRGFACSLAFFFCVVSVVVYLDRTVDVEIREQQYVGWSSPSAEKMYDHAQLLGSRRECSRASNLRSDSGVHQELLSSREGGISSYNISRRLKDGVNTSSASRTSDGEFNVEGLEQTRPTRRILKVKGALHGLGITFRKGSRAMNELVVAHLDDWTAVTDLRLFLRTLHRSGVTARADVVILFPRGLAKEFTCVLHDEEKSFWRLMVQHETDAPIHRENQQKSPKNSRARESTPETIDVSKASDAKASSSISGWQLSRKPGGSNLGPRAVGKQIGQYTGVSTANASGQNLMSLPENLPRRLKTGGLRGVLKDTLSFGEEMISKSFAPYPSSASALVRSTPRILNGSSGSTKLNVFNVDAFRQSREEGIRGKGKERRRGGGIPWESSTWEFKGDTDQEKEATVTWGDWGSVVGFDMQDFGSEEIMSGFIDAPPANLQRWMCYEMLLGVVKKQYSMVLLTEVTGVVLLGDVMSTVRDSTAAAAGGVFLFSEDRTWGQAYQEEIRSMEARLDGALRKENNDLKVDNETSLQGQNSSDGVVNVEIERHKTFFICGVHGRKTWQTLEEADFQNFLLVSGILLGNIKNVQSLSKAMTTEIVRVAAILRKSRKPFPDQPVLNFLAQKDTILGKKLRAKLIFVPNTLLRVHIVAETTNRSNIFQESSSLQMFHALQGFRHGLVSKATGNLIIQSINADICSSVYAYVYEDC